MNLKALLNRFLPQFLFVLYAVLPLVPGFGALDFGGTQWFYLSLVNIAGLVYIGFQRASIGFSHSFYLFTCAYLVLWLWGVSSFFWAVNGPEVLKYSAQLFTTFTAIYVLHYLFNKDKKGRNHFIIAILVITIILGIQVLVVFLEEIDTARNSTLIWKSKLNFSNINIASAYFAMVLPFGLWKLYNMGIGTRILGGIASFLCLSAIFLIGSRTAIASGLLIMVATLCYGAFMAVTKKMSSFRNAFLVTLLLSIGAFLLTTNINRIDPYKPNSFKSLYSPPAIVKVQGKEVQAPGKPFSSDNTRKLFYNLAYRSFKENPITGVGLGSWKLQDKAEHMNNRRGNNFVNAQYVHNDFLQMLSELGLLGGILYLSLFVLLLYIFIKNWGEGGAFFFFLGLSGSAYLLDAMLNFPLARPTTQLHFALLCALLLSLSKNHAHIPALDIIKKKTPIKIVLLGLLTVLSTLLLGKRYQELVNNKILLTDIKSHNIFEGEPLIYSYEEAMDLLPTFFEIAPDGRSYEYTASLYALSEKKYDRSLKHLDHAMKKTPYGYSVYMNKAIIYKDFKEDIDSALYYAKIGVAKTPSIKNNYTVLLPLLRQKGDTLLYLKNAAKYLSYYPDDVNEWQRYALWSLNRSKNFETALKIIDSALVANPKASNLSQLKKVLVKQQPVTPSPLNIEALYTKAIALLKKRNYQEAIVILKQGLLKDRKNPDILINLGIASIGIKDYKEAVRYLTAAIATGKFVNGVAHYNRGVAYELLKDPVNSSKDYRASKRLGYPLAQKLPERKLHP